MNRLRHYRRAAGFTQATLAKAVGCTEQTIYYLERHGNSPRLPLALRISRAVGAPVEEVFPPQESAQAESEEEVLPSA